MSSSEVQRGPSEEEMLAVLASAAPGTTIHICRASQGACRSALKGKKAKKRHRAYGVCQWCREVTLTEETTLADLQAASRMDA